MTIAPDPTWNDVVTLEPDSWAGRTFELLAGSVWLAALPPSIGFAGDLGLEDPYTYSRPPGGTDAEWFRRGTGQQKNRPTLTLGGTWGYRTADEALAHVAQVEQAVAIADTLLWRGRYLADIRADFANTCRTRTGTRFVDTTFAITLSLATRLTRAQLAEVQP